MSSQDARPDAIRTRRWFAFWTLAIVVGDVVAWRITSEIWSTKIPGSTVSWVLFFVAMAVPVVMPLLLWIVLGQESRQVGPVQVFRVSPIFGMPSWWPNYWRERWRIMQSSDYLIGFGLLIPLMVTFAAIASAADAWRFEQFVGFLTMLGLNGLFWGFLVRLERQQSKASRK